MIVYINGKYLPHDKVCISPLDRGLLHGVGAFETLRAYKGTIFMPNTHLNRLKYALWALNINPPFELENMEDILGRLLALNGLKDGRLRVTVTAGHERPAVLCTAETLPPYGNDLYRIGARTIIIDDPQRYHHTFSRIKSTSYLGNFLIREEARRRGALEAIINHPLHGPIECSMSNLFIVEDGRITTPPLSLPILHGITRDVVLKIAAMLKLPFEENAFTRDRPLGSDEVFITNTLMEVMPVTRIDGMIIGDGEPGKITLKLLSHYRKSAKGITNDSVK